MQTVSSYGVEVRKQNIPICQTLEIYRSAVSYLTEIYEQVWEELEEIPDVKRRFNAAEHLVHTTKKNLARFDFDLRFPKMPSYLRRSAIHWEAYPLMNPGWNCGKSQEKKQGGPDLYMRIMLCLFFTVM